LATLRKGESVTPAIGERMSGGDSSRPSILNEIG
jgi:hypothetical protein